MQIMQLIEFHTLLYTNFKFKWLCTHRINYKYKDDISYFNYNG